MKDKLSFFLLNHSLGAKIMKSFKSFCNGDSSTSTLNQRKTDPPVAATHLPVLSPYSGNAAPTLEEMILQLEVEEKMARRCRLDEYYEGAQRRMSCVDNSDILRSARNALNQYPRFSLDGKDAMYRSSFRNRKSFCCNGTERGRRRFPATLGGESVVWCEPGVVGKLMGLEAMPVPVNHINSSSSSFGRESWGSVMKKQSLRRKAERHEIEIEIERRRLVGMDMDGCGGMRRGVMSSSCSSTNKYSVMKPVPVQTGNDGVVVWPATNFL